MSMHEPRCFFCIQIYTMVSGSPSSVIFLLNDLECHCKVKGQILMTLIFKCKVKE